MRRRGTLATLSALFLCSAVIRVGAEIEVPFAFADTSAAPVACPPAQEAEEVLAAFAVREANLDAREDRLNARETTVAEAEAEITARLNELRRAEESLTATLALADGAADRDIERLTTVYANMKPRDAADLFAQMEPAFAAGFLIRMPPDAAALIMAGLEPETAYAISVTMAARHVGVPTN